MAAVLIVSLFYTHVIDLQQFEATYLVPPTPVAPPPPPPPGAQPHGRHLIDCLAYILLDKLRFIDRRPRLIFCPELFENFLDVLVERILSLALPILFALFASRIRRIDHFLRQYLAGAGLLISLLLAFSPWTYAGRPVRLLPLGAAALTMVVTWFFLLFCGGAVQLGLAQITGKQKEEYEKQREADAQDIAAKAIAEGDPDIATGISATNVAGAVGKAIASGCLQLVLFWFNIFAIFAVSTLDAHVLFRLSLVWSLIAAIIATATTRVLTLSEEFGERHSESVPLSEKYKGILPNREDRGAKEWGDYAILRGGSSQI